MKIGIAVAGRNALPSAFVVFRDDLCRCIDRAAEMGYDGVELALLHADEVDVPRMRQRLAATRLEIPCISSGQVFASDRLYFTHPDASVREQAIRRIIGMLELAAEFGARVNTGRVRGIIPDGEDAETAVRRYLDCLHQCANRAESLGIELIVEPVNRYEVNFINSCPEGIDIIRLANRKCVRLMPDLFHMNIEDSSFRASFEMASGLISYVHVADSNRLAPGWGHLPFDEIFADLRAIGYDGYLTAEILPKPDPERAALQAVTFLRQMLRQDNGAAHLGS
jgi:sugar phosphate isomerase/epimerase